MNEQEQLIQTIFTIGNKSLKYKIKDVKEVPQVIQLMGEQGLKVLMTGLQKVKTEEEAVALYDAIMDQVVQKTQTPSAKLGGVLQYINKLNTLR